MNNSDDPCYEPDARGGTMRRSDDGTLEIQGGRMSSMNRSGRDSAIIGVALLALVSGCATNIDGSKEPPFDWVADAASSQCAELAGDYLSAGMPAPANAHAGTYHGVWPVEGSLLSIVELGSNARPRKRPRPDPAASPDDVVPSMSIVVDASGKVDFEAKNASGGTEKLKPQTWTCEKGTLTSLASLGTANFESYVRLWKHGSALIAEQTILANSDDATGARADRPVARFYFKFPPAID
jgi:hypothetical protein